MGPRDRSELYALYDDEPGSATPGTAEGEPDGNDPHDVGPGPTPSRAEGDPEEEEIQQA